ncbi:cupin domain-containing protein [Calothrix sp. UHCC 0171]|uniref:cupin domain-containing protein n=1 Tax=Calothrix sp. UHCC 0171 TaxID=3110245 RepID=UPI002B2134CD|nr:cupin domain-containing protein [Calothrix sp. UHCC 0171]MEA5572917.1 cupin domain-containing protein [Calothrix sp. UHCC 0171]
MTSLVNEANKSWFTQLREQCEYPSNQVFSKVLFQDNNCQYKLICIATGQNIAEHSTNRHATITVIAGRGILTLAGEEVSLEPGVFVSMPLGTRHALKSEENLAFLLIFSENCR